MIYLDNSATTMPDASVLKSFTQVSKTYFGNPSSIHELGGEVEKLHKTARKQAATLLGIEADEVVFTSGGTEGNNLAIKGIAVQYQARGKHIITTEIEHASVYETCQSLREFGFRITVLPVDESGVVDLNMLEAAITDDTILISVMHVNNETGAIQPIAKIGEIAKKHPKLFFHVDGVQALGKVPITLQNSGIDLCSFSGHKIHGLKGTGMLYIKKGTVLYPLFHGGNQEQAYRSGTENVAGNVAFVRALRLILEREKKEGDSLREKRQSILSFLHGLDGVHVNSLPNGAPHIVNVSVPGVKPEVLIHALFEAGIVVSTQSACSSKQFEKSRVLDAYGFSDDIASSGIRVSLAYDTTAQDIQTFMQVFEETIAHLKGILE